MKEELIKLLGLRPDATDEQIVGCVRGLKTELAGGIKELRETRDQLDALAEGNRSRQSLEAVEKKIAKKISDSGGALNREQAIMALEHQEQADAKRAKAKK